MDPKHFARLSEISFFLAKYIWKAPVIFRIFAGAKNANGCQLHCSISINSTVSVFEKWLKKITFAKKRPRLKTLSLMVGPWEFSRFSEKGFWILKKSCWEFGIFSYFAIWKLCYPERWTFNFCTKVQNQFIFFYEVIH